MEREISLEKVFRICLTEGRFTDKYLQPSFGVGGLSFNLKLDGAIISLIRYEHHTMIWFMGISQMFDNKIGDELIQLFDKVENEGDDKTHWEDFLFKKFGAEILI
jgi:hypothetical protein